VCALRMWCSKSRLLVRVCAQVGQVRLVGLRGSRRSSVQRNFQLESSGSGVDIDAELGFELESVLVLVLDCELDS